MNDSPPHYKSILARDPGGPAVLVQYRLGENLARGNPEGSVRSHIAELERNLKRLQHKLTDLEIAKLRVLIHVHDTFQSRSGEGVPISDPNSPRLTGPQLPLGVLRRRRRC